MNRNAGFIYISIVIFFSASYGTYMRNSTWVDKIRLWEDVVHKSPQKARAYNNLGEAYHQQKQLTRAIENYNKSIQLNPYLSLDAYSNVGSVYVDIGQYDKAIDAFTKILYININDYLAYANRANAYLLKGQYQAAVEDYSRALALAPYSPEIYLRRADVYLKMHKNAYAGQDYRKACMLGSRKGCLKAQDNLAGARMND